MRKSLALKNRYLQQVEWAVFSPSLMAKPASANYIRDEKHEKSLVELLLQLDQKPSEVDEHFQSLRHMPMGKYFEQLVIFILEKDERYEIILQNHQIVEEKTTVGEIDLIVRDTVSSQLEHWEIALKFYLQSTPSSEQNVMLGPNAKDNLARKIKKLTEHQMTLSEHPQIEQLIKGQPIERKLFIKGQFFYHLNNKTIVPLGSNPLHDSGLWCFHSEIEKILDDSLKWTIVDKPDWIGNQQTPDISNAINSAQMQLILTEHFERGLKPLLCVGMKRVDKRCIEVSRCFVVNNHWPKAHV